MAAHADQMLPLADVAAVAVCGARALQLAFQRFSGTTPLAALREARLQGMPVVHPFGFSNATRFRLAYVRRFGEEPQGEEG